MNQQEVPPPDNTTVSPVCKSHTIRYAGNARIFLTEARGFDNQTQGGDLTQRLANPAAISRRHPHCGQRYFAMDAICFAIDVRPQA